MTNFFKLLLLLGGSALFLMIFAAPANAGSCYYPVTSHAWTGHVNSGVNVRDKTCMDSSVIGKLTGGSTVAVIGEADGWYKVKLADGTKGFVWNSFISITDKLAKPDISYTNEETKKEVYNKEIDKEASESEAKSLTDRLKGRILLQVENNGEAWYVHPDDGKRYYMKDGATAYQMMRAFGQGISNADMDKVLNGNASLISRLKGKILLQVELHGEAYYVHPVDGSVHYLKDGAKAYLIMRNLSLGISNQDLKKIVSRDFQAYVKETQEASDTEKDLEVSGAIALAGEVADGIVILEWSVDGTDAAKGFKVVVSEGANPVYPGNDYHYLSDPAVRHDKWKGLAPGTYHFRVCQYLGGACGVYSNDLELTVPGNSEPVVSSDGNVPAGVDLSALNKYWLNKINALRAERGLRQLVLDDRWVETATEWAVYMGENDLATHNRPDGKNMHQWIDTKGLDFTERYSPDGWSGNYFTENIAWGIAFDGSTEAVIKVLNETLDFYLSEASYNGAHYRTIYHEDWNSVGAGFHFTPDGRGGYKVYVAFHYGSLVL